MTTLYSVTWIGLECITIEVEVDLKSKVKSFEIVGLPSQAVKESIKRIESAILNSNYHFPGKRIIANLAPADIQKMGTLFDLPIAIAILSDQFELKESFLKNSIFIGELSLDGKLRPVKGALLIALYAKEQGFENVFCAYDNVKEMQILKDIHIVGIENLSQIVEFLKGDENSLPVQPEFDLKSEEEDFPFDFQDVKGQSAAKRAFEIAACGFHHILMIGPPGTGKTMLAKRLPSILPEMSLKESLETTKIYSICGLLDKNHPLIKKRPFRAPHHTASDVSIVGGGRIPMPGEVSLAHNGILFLDEFQEFKSNVLQVLRQPLEENAIYISRAQGQAYFPAKFMLVAALNPSKNPMIHNIESWDEYEMRKLFSKLSGPLLDRIDLQIQVPKISFDKLQKGQVGESSKTIKQRIKKARLLQTNRFKDTKISTNGEMTHQMIEKFCVLSDDSKNILSLAMDKYKLSIRSYDKILKIARTIADLEENESININHISEALQYRLLDQYFSK